MRSERDISWSSSLCSWLGSSPSDSPGCGLRILRAHLNVSGTVATALAATCSGLRAAASDAFSGISLSLFLVVSLESF